MAKIISVHSFRGGTGKSNTTANVAMVLASQGRRVAVIDTDIQSPGIHMLFGLEGSQIRNSLNDYLWRGVKIKKTAIDVTPRGVSGQLFLIPSSTKAGEMTRVLREGYDAQRLTRGFRKLVDELKLDVLMIDTHPGLNSETLLSIVTSHSLLILMRSDKQDYEGTGITIRMAHQLQVPHMMLVVNKTPPMLEAEAVKIQVEEACHCDVAAVLPHSEKMINLASGGIFVRHYPNHPMTAKYKEIAAQLIA